MSVKVDQFCDKLRDRLNALEGQMQSVKTSVKDVPAKAEKAVREKLDQARTKLEAQKERVEKARVELKREPTRRWPRSRRQSTSGRPSTRCGS